MRRPRESAGLSLSQAAKVTGIERVIIELYESDKHDHNLYTLGDHINTLADAYGVSAQYITGGSPVTFQDHLADGWDVHDILQKFS